MVNYKITEKIDSNTPLYNHFDELIRSDLNNVEVARVLKLLSPYIDPACFEEGNNSIEFGYIQSLPLDDGYGTEEEFKFTITKDK